MTDGTDNTAADYAVGKARRAEVRRQLAEAMQSPWEPLVIARAFATRRPGEMVFTLQVWADLEAARSPLLMGRRPEEPEDIDAAFRAFGVAEWMEIEPGRAAMMMAAALEAIAEGFAAALRMDPPEGACASSADGFGDFAPMLEQLVRKCGVGYTEALALRVSAGHILLATHRLNTGWSVAGLPYALREEAA